ncbi:uncharacterized protein UBRO_01552 [Ustilago bromivora]|uniref:Uncharacterized protein n=1 Tax=Ustilago bromivora TaxID=307758 RepID=A0A1K0H8H7_9BASI|nr:uncharacterized protein UBRO_01552 [Ustilago bromivora]
MAQYPCSTCSKGQKMKGHGNHLQLPRSQTASRKVRSRIATPSLEWKHRLGKTQPHSQDEFNDDYSRMESALCSKDAFDRAADLWDSEGSSATPSKSNNGTSTDIQDVEMAEENETLDVTLVDILEGAAGTRRALDYQGMAGRSWSGFWLEDLVRAVDVFCFYEFKFWPSYAIETAILDHLENDGEEYDTLLGDERYIAKVRCSAQQAGMYRLLALIDREKPADLEKYEGEDCRLRKWQKISAKSRFSSQKLDTIV